MVLWRWLLRTAGDLNTASRRVVRVLWAAHEGDGLVWGVSVDREIKRRVKRAVVGLWPEHKIEPWPYDARVEVSDNLPVEEGGGSVVRRFLAPRVLSRPLHTALTSPDHPMAPIGDVIADHPAVDVQMKIDVVPLSVSERERACRERLRTLDESDPDRRIWESDDTRALVAGVRVLLRVARKGPGHAAECQHVADRICRVLGTSWATDHNRLAVRKKVSDKRFDDMWTRGTVSRDVPAFHWHALKVLLAPPPAGIGRATTSKRLPDPPALPTFLPQAPGELMPIGVVSDDNGTERLVGIPWGGPTDPLVDWTVGATGSGKTWHALSRVIALAETGRGFLFLDPHRTAVHEIKRRLGARHGHRILEIDLQATNIRGEPVSAAWNPLDLTVVPSRDAKRSDRKSQRHAPGSAVPHLHRPRRQSTPNGHHHS